MPLTATSSTLYQNWQALRQTQPMLRARDAAAALDVSEAELVASRLGLDAIRLQPDWRELLPALESLGRIMALTRNEHCVHERKGIYRETTIGGSGQVGLVVSPDIDLRLFLAGWASAFAINEQTPEGMQRSLQIFDHQGVAVHKVYLTENSDLDAWATLIERFATPLQNAALALRPRVPAPVVLADTEIDGVSLRQGWAELKDTHHFLALLKKHGAQRTQALRLAGREWAERLPLNELSVLFEGAAAAQMPIMVFVGNRHCIQIHTGLVNNLRWMHHWFNVLDPDFNLHLDTRGITELWRVRKPSSDGVITSLEAIDADGELVVQLFGARKPGIPERDDWRALAEAPAALEA
ncbi:hemin-degrading factor [Stutzerimonas zhaodongensis]|uniref:Hemin-degrading factor n=1 Tax=Stutzerimonas zhaodongensis TaxID=1176257 RepID=A0A3M2HLI9_9GAMM|nr:ChuX/HutX family heme-like substrate-binding protein [Stutzerimonas zhaodongensis]MCQ4317959.1 hemin-degrading factor [Stutzerimonas zhaodongensis]RMH88239.1 hemin-degrading factor [Stutzerimonas zhaodongensis]